MVSLVDSGPWAPLIGRLFIAFGGIERTTHECIREWAGERIHKHFAHARLASRVALAKDLAKERDAPEELKAAFTAQLNRVPHLARYRNLVAHNPLCLVLLQGELESPFIEAIASEVEEGRHITFDDLKKIVEDAERCDSELLKKFVLFRVRTLDVEELRRIGGFRANDV